MWLCDLPDQWNVSKSHMWYFWEQAWSARTCLSTSLVPSSDTTKAMTKASSLACIPKVIMMSRAPLLTHNGHVVCMRYLFFCFKPLRYLSWFLCVFEYAKTPTFQTGVYKTTHTESLECLNFSTHYQVKITYFCFNLWVK